jgi:glycerol kinase
VGVWRSANQLKVLHKINRTFRPRIRGPERERLVEGWREAVARTLTSRQANI